MICPYKGAIMQREWPLVIRILKSLDAMESLHDPLRPGSGSSRFHRPGNERYSKNKADDNPPGTLGNGYPGENHPRYRDVHQ
jgi:hypothetical protein